MGKLFLEREAKKLNVNFCVTSQRFFCCFLHSNWQFSNWYDIIRWNIFFALCCHTSISFHITQFPVPMSYSICDPIFVFNRNLTKMTVFHFFSKEKYYLTQHISLSYTERELINFAPWLKLAYESRLAPLDWILFLGVSFLLFYFKSSPW